MLPPASSFFLFIFLSAFSKTIDRLITRRNHGSTRIRILHAALDRSSGGQTNPHLSNSTPTKRDRRKEVVRRRLGAFFKVSCPPYPLHLYHVSSPLTSSSQDFPDPVATQGRHLRPACDTPVLEWREPAHRVDEFAADLTHRLNRVTVQRETRARVYRGEADDYLDRHTPVELRERREAEHAELLDLCFGDETPSDFDSENENDPRMEEVYARRERIYILRGGSFNKNFQPPKRRYVPAPPVSDQKAPSPESASACETSDLNKSFCTPPSTIGETPTPEERRGRKRGSSELTDQEADSGERTGSSQPEQKKVCLVEDIPGTKEEVMKPTESQGEKRARSNSPDLEDVHQPELDTITAPTHSIHPQGDTETTEESSPSKKQRRSESTDTGTKTEAERQEETETNSPQSRKIPTTVGAPPPV